MNGDGDDGVSCMVVVVVAAVRRLRRCIACEGCWADFFELLCSAVEQEWDVDLLHRSFNL